MTRASLLAVLLLLAVPAASHAATPKLSDADRAWIAACADALAREQGTAESKRRYCACMHENFDDNRPLTQTEMERMYPPLHRACQEESGRRRR